MNWINYAIDSVVYAFAPKAGAERIATRRMFEAASRDAARYQMRTTESGISDDQRAGRWLGSRLSTDAWMDQDLETTRTKSRELYRNDFIGGAIDSRVEHVIGTGFTFQARVSEKRGVVTASQADRINQQLEDIYAQIEPTLCRTRKRSLWQKSCLIARNIDADGEAIAVFSDAPGDDIPIPLCVEIIDADRLETPPTKAADPLVRLGIQYDSAKRIVGYWIRKNHPYDNLEHSVEYDYVPADRVCHIFVEWHAGQSRGLPWLLRSLNRAKDGKDLHEAGIISAQVESCFAAFVKSESGNPLRKALASATDSDSSGARIQDIRPGSVTYLGKNDEVMFANPTKSNSVGTLVEYNNRTISAGLNWPYEMIMKDWRGVSFAGGRIVLNGAKLSVQSRQKLIRDLFLRDFWNRMVFESVLLGVVDIDPRVYAANKWHFNKHTATPPRWSYALTPGEEVNAVVTKIENNLMTLSDALAEDQQDLEEVLRQRAKERQAERDNDIVPPELAAAMTAPAPSPNYQEVAA